MADFNVTFGTKDKSTSGNRDAVTNYQQQFRQQDSSFTSPAAYSKAHPGSGFYACIPDIAEYIKGKR